MYILIHVKSAYIRENVQEVLILINLGFKMLENVHHEMFTPQECHPAVEKRSDDFTKTKFVKSCDWLTYRKTEQDEKCSLAKKISSFVQIGEEI